jgi:hypothetical protein
MIDDALERAESATAALDYEIAVLLRDHARLGRAFALASAIAGVQAVVLLAILAGWCLR